MAKILGFTSQKGGVGVTTCAVATALLLAESGERVLLIDGEKNYAPTMAMAGIGGQPTYTARDFEEGFCRAKQVVIEHRNQANLCLFPLLRSQDEKTPERVIEQLSGLFDYVICDDTGLEFCHKVCVVTEPYTSALYCASLSLAELHDKGVANTGLIINKLPQKLPNASLTPQETAFSLHTDLWGYLPYDERLPWGEWNHKTRTCFVALCDHLQGKKQAFRLQKKQSHSHLFEGDLI